MGSNLRRGWAVVAGTEVGKFFLTTQSGGCVESAEPGETWAASGGANSAHTTSTLSRARATSIGY